MLFSPADLDAEPNYNNNIMIDEDHRCYDRFFQTRGATELNADAQIMMRTLVESYFVDL
mgnify:CR=1 FL=1